MPVASLTYGFRIPIRAGARAAFAWCTDFGPDDGALFSQPTRRSVRWIGADAAVMTDTTGPAGHPVRIRRLVRILRRELAWTNTHLDGPYRGSQYWYRLLPDGPDRCQLEFRGLRLVTVPRELSSAEVRRRAERCRRADSGEWRRRLAPALEQAVASRRTVARGGRPVVREYRASDYAAVRRLWRAAGLHLGPSDSARELERSLGRDPDLFLVTEERGRIVGAVLGRFDGRRGWMNHLAVAPAARHRRIGSTLVRELERRLRQKGCRKVNLHVVRENAGVVAFYRTLGYARADLYFLEKWLRR